MQRTTIRMPTDFLQETMENQGERKAISGKRKLQELDTMLKNLFSLKKNDTGGKLRSSGMKSRTLEMLHI